MTEIKFVIDEPTKTITFFMMKKDILELAKECVKKEIDPYKITDLIIRKLHELTELASIVTQHDLLSYKPDIKLMSTSEFKALKPDKDSNILYMKEERKP